MKRKGKKMTLTPRDEMEHFKRMLKDYKYNELKIQYYTDLLGQIAYELSGVSGVNPDKIPSGNSYNSGAKSYRWYELLDNEAEMKKKKEEFEAKNALVDRMLNFMEEEDSEFLRDAFINYKTFKQCAKAKNYGINYLYQKVDRILAKVFR